MPLGYELFAGNKADVTTVEDIVNPVEGLYGKANRIWVMDRGMASRDNVAFLREQQRRYIIGTPTAMWKQFERELLKRIGSKCARACKCSCVLRRMAGRCLFSAAVRNGWTKSARCTTGLRSALRTA